MLNNNAEINPLKSEPHVASSPTAQSSHDTMGLGRTSGQRGAEILAGIRAELMPSPVTSALSRYVGQVTAKIMMRVMSAGGRAGLNFLAVRTDGFAALIKKLIADKKDPVLLVEIAAGFSPRGVELAQELPHVEVIEIDLPDVVKEKQRRLQKAITLPQNISWRAADLGVASLASVLEGRQATVITAEGLLPYFAREQQVQICRQCFDNLLPGGAMMADMSWKEGVALSQKGTRFFSNQAGRLLGIVDDQAAARGIFMDAGYQKVDVYLPTELAPQYGLPMPVMNFQLLVAAYKADMSIN
jgi:O-methyltransferase involved in polyketide biosynthesis